MLVLRPIYRTCEDWHLVSNVYATVGYQKFSKHSNRITSNALPKNNLDLLSVLSMNLLHLLNDHMLLFSGMTIFSQIRRYQNHRDGSLAIS